MICVLQKLCGPLRNQIEQLASKGMAANAGLARTFCKAWLVRLLSQQQFLSPPAASRHVSAPWRAIRVAVLQLQIKQPSVPGPGQAATETNGKHYPCSTCKCAAHSLLTEPVALQVTA
jgi:hypothetical protein